MKYKVKVHGRTFEVEIGNLDARPVIAVVEGERYEVWPEAAPGRDEAPSETPPAPPEPPPAEPEEAPARPTRRTTGVAAAAPGKAGRQVYAPIPGVVESVAVRPGDEVEAGDPLCIIEAMKMKNVIRAGRAGTVEAILVTPGEHVKHNDVLLEFAT
jgi:biotin carboxyl carrier protein